MNHFADCRHDPHPISVSISATQCLADEHSRPTPELCRLYETWSKGGTGLLITGNVQVDRRYMERPGNVAIDGEQSEEQLSLLRKFARAGQKYHSSKIFVQLGHAGRQTTGMVNMSPVGPGTTGLTNMPKGMFGTPTAMSVDDIAQVKRRFVSAAKVCQQSGFDGIQIHAAHGYLLSSFMNPLANNRPALFGDDDAYGGSLEKRCRLLLDTVKQVRAAVGDAFPISVKLNSKDFQTGGFTDDECVEVALRLEEAGVDVLELSGGNYDSSIFKEDDLEGRQSALDAKIEKYRVKRSTALREAYYLKYSRDVIRALQARSKGGSRMCIMCTGGFRSKRVMLEAVNSGGCDVVGIGRPLCGEADGSRLLLESGDEGYCLPRYEGTLVVGWPVLYANVISNAKWSRWLPILVTLNFVAKQYWYYMQIIAMGRTGKTELSWGCLAALLANFKHERKCAGRLLGIRAVGSVYNKGGSVDKPPLVLKEVAGYGEMWKVGLPLMLAVVAAIYYYVMIRK